MAPTHARIIALAFPVAAALAAPAAATITLNDGNAVFSNTVPTTPTSTGGAAGNFAPDGTTDHLFRFSWHWRLNGVDSREFVFSSATGAGVTFNESGSGTDTGTQSWTGLDSGRFSAVLTSVLTDGGSAGQAILYQTMRITNTSASPLNMALYNYADYHMGSTFANDSASLFAADTIRIVDGANFAQHQGVGADAYSVTAFSPSSSNVVAALTNSSVTNFANTGLPFAPEDYMGAWQWNETVGVGQSVVLVSVHAINQTIPAPGALALLGFAGLARRRRRS